MVKTLVGSGEEEPPHNNDDLPPDPMDQPDQCVYVDVLTRYSHKTEETTIVQRCQHCYKLNAVVIPGLLSNTERTAL